MEVLAIVEEEGDTWMTPIFKYLKDRTLPAEAKKARTVRRKSWRFSVINGTLYKKSFLGPWLRMHASTRSVVAKALRIGYYWLTMHEDARMLIRACQDCQVHKPVPKNPQQKLSPITSSWPFYKWGIDIAGPFPEGPGKVKFLIVAIDYFTKWIEAKPVATITGNQIKNSYGTILFVDSDFQEKSSRIMESSSRTIRSRIVIMESLVKKKQKGAILELKRRHLKNTIFCTYTPYPAIKIRRISASSTQETRNDQFLIRRIHYNQYTVCTAVRRSK
ncbi:reverse transcriptase domain-containing protein, partial [Tanacetum coccineum]